MALEAAQSQGHTGMDVKCVCVLVWPGVAWGRVKFFFFFSFLSCCECCLLGLTETWRSTNHAVIVRAPSELDIEVQGQSEDLELGEEDSGEASGAGAEEVLPEVPGVGDLGVL